MRPRTIGKIVIGVLIFLSVAIAIDKGIRTPDTELEYWKHFHAVTFAVLSVTFAILYRYFED